MVEHLSRTGRLIGSIDEAKAWAAKLKATVQKGRCRGGFGAVQSLDFYRSRMTAVRKLCDASRSKVTRASLAGGIKRELLGRERLKRDEFIETFKVDDTGLIREILRVFDQGRTNFGAEQPWILDLIEAGKGGKGERNQRDHQIEILTFLASYGPNNPQYTIADFSLCTRLYRTPFFLQRWLEVQQSQIIEVKGCLEWRLFRRLCLDRDIEDWFCELCAHQWFLYRTGYLLEQASFLYAYMRNHIVFYGPSSDVMEACLARIDDVLFEFHCGLSGLRLIGADRAVEGEQTK